MRIFGMGFCVIVLLGAGLAGANPGGATSSPEKHLRVGFSKIDITPYEEAVPARYAPEGSGPRTRPLFERPPYRSPWGPVFVGGFGPYVPAPFVKNRWAQGVHDPVWARALAIEGEGGNTVLLISTDLPGLTWKHINPVRRELEKVFRIPAANIIITSTHNHAGPDAAGYWTALLPGHSFEYTRQLRLWLLHAATDAIRAMEPARVRTLTTTHLACQDPKTRELKRPQNCRFAPTSTSSVDADGSPYDREIIQSDKRDPKVYNHRITIQHFTRAGSAETIGTFINWHNHPDTLGSANRLISSDFPHYLRKYVEDRLGGTAVYFSGTVGCQIGPGSPVPAWSHDGRPLFQEGVADIHGNPVRAFTGENRWERMRSIGYEIGHEVVEAVRTAAGEPSETLALEVKTEPLDVAPNNFLHFLATRSVWRFDVEPEDSLHWYLPRCGGRYGCVRSDVSLLQLGDLTVLTAPGEIDPAYLYGRNASHADYAAARRGKDRDFPAMTGVLPLLRGPHIAVLGQANNYLSYLLPETDNVGPLHFKQAPHYEELVTVNRHFGDDVGNKWMQMLGSSQRYSNRRIYPGGSR